MNLQDLNSGTPATKQWLNPVVGSLTTGAVYESSTYTNVTVSPTTLTPSQYVGAIIQATNGEDITINTPAASDFKTYFGNELTTGFTFTTNFYKNAAFNGTINLGTGVLTYGGASSIAMTSANGQNNIQMIYRYTGTSWVVYYIRGS
jgi:hypothetical protein